MDLENLVNEVAKYRCLYDIKSEEYKNRYKKTYAWHSVALAMGSDESTCQKKWRSIRDTYVQKNKEALDETRSGAGASNKKGWYLMPYLGFLKTIYDSSSRPTPYPLVVKPEISYSEPIFTENIVFANSSTSIPFAKQTTPTSNAIGILVSNASNSNSGSSLDDSYISEVGLEQDHSYSSSAKSNNINPGRVKSKRKKCRQLEAIETQERDVMRMLEDEQMREKLYTEKDYTDTEMFLLSLAPSIDQLEPAKKAWTQVKIQTMVAEALYGPDHS